MNGLHRIHALIRSDQKESLDKLSDWGQESVSTMIRSGIDMYVEEMERLNPQFRIWMDGQRKRYSILVHQEWRPNHGSDNERTDD